jgi:hypothetical protein
MVIPVRYAPVSFTQRRIKYPITIPGEKIMPLKGIIEFIPSLPKAEKGNNEKGNAA